MSKYNFTDKNYAAFSYSGIEGYGRVVGAATAEMAILGRFYMVEVLTSNQNLPNDSYPFKIISMPEVAMVKLELDYTSITMKDSKVYPVKHDGDVVCYIKIDYMNALSSMPEPERSHHTKQWADALFKDGKLPETIGCSQLHQFLRHVVRCK
ncbi:hypothetical protein D3C76_102820 [compost metagenome]